MGSTTRIDWANATWNPVTGCLHGCKYCYARGIARRFGGHLMEVDARRNTDKSDSFETHVKTIHELDRPMRCSDGYEYMRMAGISAGRILPYPYDFEPTLHRYALERPKHWKIPKNIFVCSMADLFGEWVPDGWIRAVFDACSAALQHRYLFLTKNPKRYGNTYPLYLSCIQRPSKAFEAWFGYSYDGTSNQEIRKSLRRQYSRHQFISIEPMLSPIWEDEINMIRSTCDWVIIGAETGNRKGKVKPEKKWIMKIADMCKMSDVPVFMKDSLREIVGSDFRQEFPWEMP